MNQPTYNPQQQVPQTNLPPPGYQREEELKQRTDNLQQQGEVKAAQEQRFTMDPSKLQPIREIRHNMSALNVTPKVAGYEYCWVNFKSPSDTPGLTIQQKQAHQVYNYQSQSWEAVWEVVHGNMPECAHRKGIGADSTRRLGDVLLMRAKKENYDSLVRYQQEQNNRRLQADEAAFVDEVERVNSKTRGGLTAHPHGHPGFMSSAGRQNARGTISNVPAPDELDWQLKSGRLPGPANVENWAGKK